MKKCAPYSVGFMSLNVDDCYTIWTKSLETNQNMYL